MNNHEFTNQLSSIIPIVNYRGVNVEKVEGGYKIFGQKVSTKKEVDAIIEGAGLKLSKSIKKTSL